MILVTRCPHCETVFRVQHTQLARTRGHVRCGHCNQVFDALQNLLDPSAGSAITFGEGEVKQEAPAAMAADVAAVPLDRVNGQPHESVDEPSERAQSEPREPAAPPSAPAAPEGNAGTADEPPSTFADIVADELREPPIAATPAAKPIEAGVEEAPRAPHTQPTSTPPIAPGSPIAPDPSAEREHVAPRPQAQPGTERGDELKPSLGDAPPPLWRRDQEPRFRMPPSSEPQMPPPRDAARTGVPPFAAADERARPFGVTREPRAPARRHGWLRVVGAVLALVLIVVLAAQLIWWRREAVMVYWPASQPLFADVCTRLGCQISPPRDIDGLQIEASDLRQIDGPHRLELRVPLRNRYDIALAYPAIELTLFDEKNEIAIRRVLWPQDYAPPGTAIAAGLSPHTTQTMIVRLDSGNAVATNFRVQIFYP
jgi:predicted Zn finger-like uncharacterized protein